MVAQALETGNRPRVEAITTQPMDISVFALHVVHADNIRQQDPSFMQPDTRHLAIETARMLAALPEPIFIDTLINRNLTFQRVATMITNIQDVESIMDQQPGVHADFLAAAHFDNPNEIASTIRDSSVPIDDAKKLREELLGETDKAEITINEVQSLANEQPFSENGGIAFASRPATKTLREEGEQSPKNMINREIDAANLTFPAPLSAVKQHFPEILELFSQFNIKPKKKDGRIKIPEKDLREALMRAQKAGKSRGVKTTSERGK